MSRNLWVTWELVTQLYIYNMQKIFKLIYMHRVPFQVVRLGASYFIPRFGLGLFFFSGLLIILLSCWCIY